MGDVPLSDLVPRPDQYIQSCFSDQLDTIDPEEAESFCKVMVSAAGKAFKSDKVALVHMITRSDGFGGGCEAISELIGRREDLACNGFRKEWGGKNGWGWGSGGKNGNYQFTRTISPLRRWMFEMDFGSFFAFVSANTSPIFCR